MYERLAGSITFRLPFSMYNEIDQLTRGETKIGKTHPEATRTLVQYGLQLLKLRQIANDPERRREYEEKLNLTLKTENVDLYTLLNFEMIGVPLIDKDYLAFLTGYELSNMAEKINETTKMNLVGASEISKKYQLFKRSDNYPFYEQFNLPCQSVSTCDMENFEYYHHTEDEAEKMDYEHMASFINNMIPAIEAMTNSETKEIKMYAQ